MNHAKVKGQIMFFLQTHLLLNRWTLHFQILQVYTSHNAEDTVHCFMSPCPKSQG